MDTQCCFLHPVTYMRCECTATFFVPMNAYPIGADVIETESITTVVPLCPDHVKAIS